MGHLCVKREAHPPVQSEALEVRIGGDRDVASMPERHPHSNHLDGEKRYTSVFRHILRDEDWCIKAWQRAQYNLGCV